MRKKENEALYINDDAYDRKRFGLDKKASLILGGSAVVGGVGLAVGNFNTYSGIACLAYLASISPLLFKKETIYEQLMESIERFKCMGKEDYVQDPHFRYGQQPLVYLGNGLTYRHKDQRYQNNLYKYDRIIYASLPEVFTSESKFSPTRVFSGFRRFLPFNRDKKFAYVRENLDGFTADQYAKRKEDAWAKLYDLIISQIKGASRYAPLVRHIILDLPPNLPENLKARIQGLAEIDIARLMEEKRFKAKDTNQTLPVIPMTGVEDSPENITFRPKVYQERSGIRNSGFLKAAGALSDKKFQTIIAETRKPGLTLKEEIQIEKMVVQRLHEIIYQELGKKYASVEATSYRDPRTNLPIRDRRYSWFQLFRMSDGQMTVRVGNSEGYLVALPLNQVLGVSGVDPLEITLAKNRMTPAQIAYALDRILIERKPKPVLVPRPAPTEQEVLEEFEELGLKIRANRRNLRSLVAARRDWKDSFRFARNLALPAAMAAMVFLSPFYVSDLRSNVSRVTQLASNLTSSTSVPASITTLEATISPTQVHKTAFPTGFSSLASSAQWQLESRGGFSLNGYYTTDTSHEITPSAEWRIHSEVKQPLIGISDSDNIDLGIILSTQTRQNRIKIPIKDQTRLQALKVTKGDQPVHFNASLLTDGTVMLEIPAGTGAVNIEAVLVPDENGQVHSAGRLDQAFDISKVNGEAAALIVKAYKDHIGDPYSYERVANVVREHYEYSLDPENKEILDETNSPTERLNAIAKLSGCSCDICSEQSLLISSLWQDPNRTLSRASGYLHGIPGTGEEGSFLSTDSLHAYEITDKGKIIDPTPNKIAGDPLTQEYIKRLSLSANNQELKEDQNEFIKWLDTLPQEQIATARLGLGGLLTLSAAYITAVSLRKRLPGMRKGAGNFWEATKERLQQAKENRLRRVEQVKPEEVTVEQKKPLDLTNEELEFGYSVFNWLCWAPENSAFTFNPRSDSSTDELIKSLHDLSPAVLKEYLINPSLLEGKINLSEKEKQELKKLAEYLVSSTIN